MKNLKTFIAEEEYEVHASEINALIKSVGGGSKSAGVFESWVHIVSSISGATKKPNASQVKAALGGEFHPLGKKWLKKIKFGEGDKALFDENKVLLAMYFVGGDIKDISGLPWGSLDVIHASIDDYYDKLPQFYKDQQSKQNTADIVFITKGNKASLFAALDEIPKTGEDNIDAKGSIKWTDAGKMSIRDKKGIEWYQISLKKGIDDARIGKLGAYLQGKYGDDAGGDYVTKHDDLKTEEIEFRGNYLGMSYGFNETTDLILLDEGLFDAFKAIKDKIAGSFSKLASWAAGKFKGLIKGFIGLARKTLKSNPVLDNANEIAKLAGASNLGESFLFEGKDDIVEFKKTETAIKRFEILYSQLNSDMVNKEYYKVKSNVERLNGRKSPAKINPAVMLSAKDTNALIDKEYFKQKTQIVIDKLKNNDDIYRSELFLPFKVASHYTSYNTINVILKDINSNIKGLEGVLTAAMSFVATTKAEAKFGNTQLPLWIVYGQGGKAHYYGVKDTYIKTTMDDLLKAGKSIAEVKSLDQPYVVVRIEKAGSSKGSYGLGGHNVTEVYLMSGIDDKKIPKYLLLNFTTVSGSKFSMKAEAEKEITKKWL